MTDDVFNSDDNDQQSNNTDETGDLVSSLVGEDKKFKTLQDLAKSKLEADKFIKQLQDENKGIRETLEAMEAKGKDSKTLEDLMKLVKEATSSKDDEGNQSKFTAEELKEMVQNQFVELKTQDQRKQNRQRANDQVLAKFDGDKDKASEFVRKRASELGMEIKTLTGMAESSPLAFTQLLGLSSQGGQARSGGTHSYQDVNTDSKDFHGAKEDKNHAYYMRIKRESPSKFFKPEVQLEMLREAERQGADFYKT